MRSTAPDFYNLIHKAIRLAMSEFLVRLGSTDASDAGEWAAAAHGWTKIRRLLDAHSLHEDAHIHPLIHIAAPEIAELLDRQHEELDGQVRAIDQMVTTIDGETDATLRRQAARKIYQSFSAFTASYYGHLIEEETRAMPALLARFSPEELLAAHHRLIGSMPPEERLGDLPIIARSLSAPERIALMAATQAGAPPAFFAEACRIMEEAIGSMAFATVTDALAKKAS